MKRAGIGVAILILIALVILAPSIKTLFETFTTAAKELAGEEFPPFVGLILGNLPIIFIIGGFGAVLWLIFRSRRGER